MIELPRRAIENWIPTRNPFGLAKPPEWFLDQMFAQDPELRIFGSVYEPVYRVMRKVTTATPWTTFLKDKPDTAIAAAHKLWPVTSVLPQTVLGFSWARLLLELAERDQQRFANPDAVERRKQEIDDQREASTQRQIVTELEARNSAFYGAYKFINGERVGASTTSDGVAGGRRHVTARKPRGGRIYRPAGGGSVPFWTGRGAGPQPKPHGRISG